MVTIEINGQELQVPKGQMVIQAAEAAGIAIPRFCYHKRLSTAASCRMCLVEVERAPKSLPACATQVAEGMKVSTRSRVALDSQRAVMEFLLVNHPLDCPICDQGGECELQDIAVGYGAGESSYRESKRIVKDQNIGALIATEMTRCIHCTRCVRFGQEVGGEMELGTTGRGEQMRISTFLEHTIESELSGNMIDLCPVGALTSRPFRFSARSWELQQHESVSPHDCVGSNLRVDSTGDRVKRVVARENAQINESWISDRDRFGYTGLADEFRLTEPMVRDPNGWRTASWEEALGLVVDGLKKVVGEHGADQLGALAAPTATVEEGYLLQSLVRGLGSNNIDHRLRQGDFRDGGVVTPCPDLMAKLEQADVIVLVGSTLRTQQPLLNSRVRKAAQAGAKVIHLDSVGSAGDYDLTEELVVAPDQLPALLAGLLKASMHSATPAGADQWRALLAELQPDAEQQAIAAILTGAERAVILVGDNAQASPHYSLITAYSRALAEVTGGSFAAVTAGGNGVGLAQAGVLPDRGLWNRPLAVSGLDARAMLASPRRAYLLLDCEPQLDCWDSAAASQAMAAADFVVALTPYRSDLLMQVADVLLPSAPFTETPGTLVNIMGMWQSFSAAVKPLGEARPAWKVLRVLGNLLGLEGFGYNSAQDVLGELSGRVERQSELGPVGELPALPNNNNGLSRVGPVACYSSDAMVRRAECLQGRRDSGRAAASVNPALATRLGLAAGEQVTVSQGGDVVVLPLLVDDQVADECVVVPAAELALISLGAAVGPVTLEPAT